MRRLWKALLRHHVNPKAISEAFFKKTLQLVLEALAVLRLPKITFNFLKRYKLVQSGSVVLVVCCSDEYVYQRM